MASTLYQQDLLRLAAQARGASRLDDPDGSATVDNPLCGDRITLDVTLNDNHIERVGYKVKACMLCQAAASVIGANAPGLTIEDATHAAAEARGVLAGKIEADQLTWPELKAFVPVREVKSRHECVLLPVEALERAIKAARSDPAD